MTIKDSTRKRLWVKSGNQCAICKRALVEPTGDAEDGTETIVGEEAHIHGRRPGSARYDPALPLSRIDDYGNLLLLCPTDHTLVDDRPHEYPAAQLAALKSRHERRVAHALGARRNVWPLGASPVRTGLQLLDVVWGAQAYQFDHDEPRSEQDATAIAALLQTAHDYGEISGDLPVSARTVDGYNLNPEVEAIWAAGYSIYGTQATRLMRTRDVDELELPVGFLVVKRT